MRARKNHEIQEMEETITAQNAKIVAQQVLIDSLQVRITYLENKKSRGPRPTLNLIGTVNPMMIEGNDYGEYLKQGSKQTVATIQNLQDPNDVIYLHWRIFGGDRLTPYQAKAFIEQGAFFKYDTDESAQAAYTGLLIDRGEPTI